MVLASGGRKDKNGLLQERRIDNLTPPQSYYSFVTSGKTALKEKAQLGGC